MGRATTTVYDLIIGMFAFQSTPSVGRATLSEAVNTPSKRISIHALRGEGDKTETPSPKLYKDFNPRPPWGGRPFIVGLAVKIFNISIHALRGEGDIIRLIQIALNNRFQSTPSVGRATIKKMM